MNALSWNGLYKAGGVAALLAALVFRRNLAAEAALLGVHAPDSVTGWFTLFQDNPLLGLALFGFFDAVDYALMSIVFLALYGALHHRADRGTLLVATASGLVGTAVYSASNTAFSMLWLSTHHAAAVSDTRRAVLAASGEVALALNNGTGSYLSLLLLAVATLLFSVAMLRSRTFGRLAGGLGVVAGLLDLVYCPLLPVAPVIGLNPDLAGVATLPAAGLLLMVWHILIGFELLRLERAAAPPVALGRSR